jgi:hypothetical protein
MDLNISASLFFNVSPVDFFTFYENGIIFREKIWFFSENGSDPTCLPGGKYRRKLYAAAITPLSIVRDSTFT